MQTQKHIPFTPNTSTLISQLIDINWEIKTHKEENAQTTDYFSRLVELEEQFADIENLIIEDMGQEGYDNFMAMGRKMFASK